MTSGETRGTCERVRTRGHDRSRRLLAIVSGCVLGVALLVVVPPARAVVGGTPVSRALFPAFSVVGTGCGGALIAPDRVLTAAHCRSALEESDEVLVGPHSERRTVRRQAINPLHVRELDKIEREFPPPAADLMILELGRPVTDVPVATIATAAEGLTRAGTPATTIGRGATGTDGAGQGVFRSAMVDVVAPESCADQLDTALLRRWSICTRGRPVPGPAGRTVLTSACFGDSGSPLLAGPVGSAKIIGVVSWGPSCGEQGDPELYANTVKGRDFALASKPAWAPAVIGRAHITGTAAVGHTVTCHVHWLVKPTRNLDYGFLIDGFQKQDGPRPTFHLASAYRGKEVSCTAIGETIGGRGGAPGIAPPRVVR
jgi:trypsin